MKNKVKLLYAIRDFIHTLPYHTLVMGSVFVVASIFDKYIEAVCFLVSFFSLRYKFPTTYHSKSIVLCMVLTNSIFALSVVLCPPAYMYFGASILFAYLDCFLLWFIQDRLECKKLLSTYTSKTIWNMPERELRDYLYCQNIRDEQMEFVVYKLTTHLTYEEIGEKLGYTVPTLKVWSKKCKAKLKIDSWKQPEN